MLVRYDSRCHTRSWPWLGCSPWSGSSGTPGAARPATLCAGLAPRPPAAQVRFKAERANMPRSREPVPPRCGLGTARSRHGRPDGKALPLQHRVSWRGPARPRLGEADPFRAGVARIRVHAGGQLWEVSLDGRNRPGIGGHAMHMTLAFWLDAQRPQPPSTASLARVRHRWRFERHL